MSSGWLTTKKAGRDDAKIARDRAKAVAQRRKQRGLQPKKKRQQPRDYNDDDDDDDDDSMDDFIVQDDDEELNDDDESDSEEPEVVLGDDDDDSSSSSRCSEEEGTFFKTYQKRTSRPPPKLQHNNKNSKKKRVLQKLQSNRNKQAAAFQKVPTDFCSSEDGDDDHEKQKVIEMLSSSDDDDDDDDDEPDGKMARASSSSMSSSRFFSPTATHHARTDDDDDETPFVPQAIRKKRPYQRTTIPDDNDHDDDDDDDEQLALALALSESLQQHSPSSLVSSSNSLEGSKKQKVERLQEDDDDHHDKLLLLEEDESDNDDDDKEDDYVLDEEEEEARSVLETAQELRAQILQALHEWSQQLDCDNNDGTSHNNKALLASGAVTLSTYKNSSRRHGGGGAAPNKNNSNNNKWISQEEMATVCPAVTLADYQLIGVNWMALLHGLPCTLVGGTTTTVNGILADEMGLGKTVQTIAFMCWLKQHHQQNHQQQDDNDDEYLPHLVIAPASVLSNWEREFQTFAPHLNVVKYHGTLTERDDLQENLRPYLPAGGRRRQPDEELDVILAPITYFSKEKSDDRSFLKKFQYDFLVVDEAHVLKNAQGNRYKMLDRFRSKHRLLLTGTPVQNSPKELLSLLCFLMPLFSRKSSGFDDDNDTKNDGGERMLQHFVSLEKMAAGAQQEESAYDRLKQLFAPFVLRRRKQDVLSQVMPPKVQKVDFVELPEAARRLYDSLLSEHVRAKKKGSNSAREHLFTQLRKAAHHPLLLRARYQTPSEKEDLSSAFYKYQAFRGEGCTKSKVAEELERFNDFQIHLTALELVEENALRRPDLERYILNEEDLFASCKFVRLRQLLPELIGQGHRILIFSVWTSCMDLMGCLLENMDMEFLRMDGSTAVEERQGLIDKFNQNPSIPVFLLSTKACGLGINLTSADTCIFHDLDFNPMNDVQAEDRCHRIGQKKEVTVIRLVSKDTVDQDIYEMQQRKMKMSQVIMATDGSESSDWSKQASKEKRLVLNRALDRFMQSPSAKKQDPEDVDDGESDDDSTQRDAL